MATPRLDLVARHAALSTYTFTQVERVVEESRSLSFRASAASRGIATFPVEGQASRLFRKRTQISLMSQITQRELHEAVGAPLRHQRDLRDQRLLLEDAMMPGVHRSEGSRFLDSPSARSE
jgi:hypothetical protein